MEKTASDVSNSDPFNTGAEQKLSRDTRRKQRSVFSVDIGKTLSYNLYIFSKIKKDKSLRTHKITNLSVYKLGSLKKKAAKERSV